MTLDGGLGGGKVAAVPHPLGPGGAVALALEVRLGHRDLAEVFLRLLNPRPVAELHQGRAGDLQLKFRPATVGVAGLDLQLLLPDEFLVIGSVQPAQDVVAADARPLGHEAQDR